MKDYSRSTLADVDEIVRVVRALREVARKSKVQTARTQSLILRALPAEVLCAVAVKLNESTADDTAVSNA